MAKSTRAKLTPAGFRRVAAATKGFERLYKGGKPGRPSVPLNSGNVAVFVVTATVSAGTANSGAASSPGSGTATMWTGNSATTRAADKTGITIWNDGIASIAVGTQVYCVFLCGDWFVFWVLCP